MHVLLRCQLSLDISLKISIQGATKKVIHFVVDIVDNENIAYHSNCKPQCPGDEFIRRDQ